jgi:hypothetical protein
VLDFKWIRSRLRRRPPVIVPESNPALVVLRDLVAEIEGAGYRDQSGDRLELKAAFRDARDLVYGYPPRRERRKSRRRGATS